MMRTTIVILTGVLIAASIVTVAGEASSQIVLAQRTVQPDASERTVRDCTRSATQKIPGHEVSFIDLHGFTGNVRAPSRTPERTLAAARAAAIACIVKKGGKKAEVDKKGDETYRIQDYKIVVTQWDRKTITGWVSFDISDD